MYFAVATSNIRNPLFLSVVLRGLRKNARNDTAMLPLLVGNGESGYDLFYHYRKRRLIKHSDENILFYLPVNLNRRKESFQGLQILSDGMFTEWDSRIEERSRLLSEKVLIPMLKQNISNDKQSLRMLDVGGGAGQFTSKIISNVIKSKVLNETKLELTVLDVLPIDPMRHFKSNSIIKSMATLEYISNDYKEGITKAAKGMFGSFDLVFIFRILHNLSSFNINCFGLKETENRRGRYTAFDHLSNYYKAITILYHYYKYLGVEAGGNDTLFAPSRCFNPDSLTNKEGDSLIELLLRIGKGIIIEDGDLAPRDFIKHMNCHKLQSISIYDLSKVLHLSVNHIYFVTKGGYNTPHKGEKIWPK